MKLSLALVAASIAAQSPAASVPVNPANAAQSQSQAPQGNNTVVANGNNDQIFIRDGSKATETVTANGNNTLVLLGDGTDTVTAQGPQTWTGHARSGDFYPAKNGDLHLATSGDFFMATDTLPHLAELRSLPLVSNGARAGNPTGEVEHRRRTPWG